MPPATGRWPGLLSEWRRTTDGRGWQGRVVYAVDDDGRTVLVEDWIDAHLLEPT